MKIKTFKQLCAVATLAGAIGTLTLTSGCLAVAAGAAGAGAAVAYVRGELKATVEANFNRTVTAANAAVADLQFAKISEKRDALAAVIVARTALDKKIEITVENGGQTVSTVKIRVGLVGDESLSLTILDKIKARL